MRKGCLTKCGYFLVLHVILVIINLVSVPVTVLLCKKYGNTEPVQPLYGYNSESNTTDYNTDSTTCCCSSTDTLMQACRAGNYTLLSAFESLSRYNKFNMSV